MKKEIMKKRFLTIVLAGVCSVSLLTACGGESRNTGGTEKVNKTAEKSIEKTSGIQADDPGAFIEQLYQVYMIDRSEDYGDMWKNYVSEKSKELGFMTEDEFTSNIRQNAFTYEYKDVLVNSQTNVGDNITKVNVSIKTADGATDSTDEYVIEENGAYKILVAGVIDVDKLGNTEQSGDFALENVFIYYQPEGITLTYDFRNNSDRLVYLSAWASTPMVKMTTEDGSEYTCSFDSMVSVQPGNSDTETLYFAGAKGTPKALSWDTITYCNERNLPDGTASFTVNIE